MIQYSAKIIQLTKICSTQETSCSQCKDQSGNLFQHLNYNDAMNQGQFPFCKSYKIRTRRTSNRTIPQTRTKQKRPLLVPSYPHERLCRLQCEMAHMLQNNSENLTKPQTLKLLFTGLDVVDGCLLLNLMYTQYSYYKYLYYQLRPVFFESHFVWEKTTFLTYTLCFMPLSQEKGKYPIAYIFMTNMWKFSKGGLD